MTGPTSTSELTDLCRRFVSDLRTSIATKAMEGSAEEIVERVIATISTVVAAIMMTIPKTRRHAGIIGALLAIGMRILNRKGAHDAGS